MPYLPSSSRLLHTVLLAAVLLALLLLLLAALPPSTLRRAPAARLLATWRAHIAAAGFSALLAAGVIFVVAGV